MMRHYENYSYFIAKLSPAITAFVGIPMNSTFTVFAFPFLILIIQIALQAQFLKLFKIII